MTAPKRIVALEGLRGAAALLVVADHAIDTAVQKMGAVSADVNLAWYLGALGVSTFFVISGLVMITVHDGDFGSPGAGRAFLRKRLTRIVSLYWLATIIYAAKLHFEHHNPTASDLIQSLLFIPHQADGKEFGWPVCGLGWTLQYEMIFYFVFSICLSFPRKVGLSMLLAVFPILTAFHFFGAFAGHKLMDYITRPITLLFVAGILIGLARNRYFTQLEKLSFNQAMVLCATCMGSSIFVADMVRNTDYDFVIGSVAGVLAVATCAMSMLGDKMSFGERVALLAGGGSYATYLSHAFALGPLGRITDKFYHSCPVPLFVAAALTVAVVIGSLTFRFIEQPILRYLGRFVKGPAVIVVPPLEQLGVGVEPITAPAV